LATVIDIPNVFEFKKKEILDKINEYKKEPDLIIDYTSKSNQDSIEK